MRRRKLLSTIVMLVQLFVIATILSLSHSPLKAGATGSVDITGNVTDQSSNGIADVSVFATDPGGSTVEYGPVTTYSSGYYDLSVNPGTYDIHFMPSGNSFNPLSDNSVTVNSSETINVQLFTASTSHTFSGTVIDANGNPVSGLNVQLSGQGGSEVATDANGNFSMTVPAGTYSLYVEGSPANLPSAFYFNGVSLDLTSSDVTQNIQLPPTTTVTVIADDSNGNPVSNISAGVNGGSGSFAIFPGDSSLIATAGDYGTNGNTNSNGSFVATEFQGLTNVNACANYPVGGSICNSSLSTANGATTVIFEPGLLAPTNLTAPSPTNTAPALSWTGVSGAAYYNVFRNGEDVGSSNTTAFTDTNAPSGSNSYYVTAVSTDGNQSGSSNTITVVYNPTIAPTITSANAASTGMRVPFSFTVTTTGSPSPALTESGTLPSGLTFVDNGDGTASISGTPAVGTNGTYPITITANNGISPNATQTFNLTVTTATSTPAITSSSTDTEEFGMPFSFTVTTTGYPVPTLKKTGTLPPGVTFTDNGNGTATIAGTPDGSASGTYTITIKAKNSVGTSTQTFTETITKVPIFKAIPKKDLTATVGTQYSLTVTSSAYNTATMSYSGTLPSGLSFADNGNGTATISGTPQTGAGGTYPITVTATNSYGSTNDAFTISVDEAPTITSSNNATATRGTAFSFQVTASGYPSPTYALTGTLPTGLHFAKSTGTFSGTPRDTDTPGTYTFTITATNSVGSSTAQSFSVTLL